MITKRNYVPGEYEQQTVQSAGTITVGQRQYFVLDGFYKFLLADISVFHSVSKTLVNPSQYELVIDQKYTDLETGKTGKQLYAQIKFIDAMLNGSPFFVTAKNFGTYTDNEATKLLVDSVVQDVSIIATSPIVKTGNVLSHLNDENTRHVSDAKVSYWDAKASVAMVDAIKSKGSLNTINKANSDGTWLPSGVVETDGIGGSWWGQSGSQAKIHWTSPRLEIAGELRLLNPATLGDSAVTLTQLQSSTSGLAPLSHTHNWDQILGTSRNIDGVDLNNLVDTGFFAGGALVNAPSTGYWFVVNEVHVETSWITQTVTSYGGGANVYNAGAKLRRNKYGGTAWTPWVSIADGENLGNLPIPVTDFSAGTVVTGDTISRAIGKLEGGKQGVISASSPIIKTGNTLSHLDDANTRHFTDTERTKLASVATNANNYIHPANHPASIITQDANNRFTTDAEKTKWSAKGASGAIQVSDGLGANMSVGIMASYELSAYTIKTVDMNAGSISFIPVAGKSLIEIRAENGYPVFSSSSDSTSIGRLGHSFNYQDATGYWSTSKRLRHANAIDYEDSATFGQVKSQIAKVTNSDSDSQNLFDLTRQLSSMWVSGCGISIGTNVTISTGVVMSRASLADPQFNRYVTEQLSFASSTVANSSTLFVYADNSATIKTTTNPQFFEAVNAVPLYIITKAYNGEFSVQDVRDLNQNARHKAVVQTIRTKAITKAPNTGNLSVSGIGFSVDSMTIFFDDIMKTINPFSTNDGFVYSYHNGTGFTNSVATVITANKFDNSTPAMGTIQANKYGNHWVFVDTAGTGKWYVIPGRSAFDSTLDASAESIPSIRIGELGDYTTYEPAFRLCYSGAGVWQGTEDLFKVSGGATTLTAPTPSLQQVVSVNGAVSASIVSSGANQWSGTNTYSTSPTIPNATASNHPITKSQFDAHVPERSLTSYGAIGDGVTNDTTAIQVAVDSRLPIRVDGRKNFLVTSIDQKYGQDLSKSGNIVKSVAGGLQKINTYVDEDKIVFGQEYMYAFHNKLISQIASPTAPMVITFSGDSTTVGADVEDSYKIHNIVKLAGYASGLNTAYGTNCINRGQSGKATFHWVSDYLAGDLATNPDLLVLRWGINDRGYLKNGSPAPLDSGQNYANRRDAIDFITSLRSGLTTIRASRGVESLSIMLMSPNSTSDTPNGRDELYYEEIVPMIKRACRDFSCCFVDAYALSYGARVSAGLWMDNPFGDGRAIHPLRTLNAIIAREMVGAIYPNTLSSVSGYNNVFNTSGAEIIKTSTDLPITYPKGFGVWRAFTGFPLDGTVINISSVDETVLQFNTGYPSSLGSRLYIRTGRRVDLGDGPAGWDEWVEITTSKNISTAQLSVTDFSAGTVVTGDTIARALGKLQGSLKTNSNAHTLTSGDSITFRGRTNHASVGSYVVFDATSSSSSISCIRQTDTTFAKDGTTPKRLNSGYYSDFEVTFKMIGTDVYVSGSCKYFTAYSNYCCDTIVGMFSGSTGEVSIGNNGNSGFEIYKTTI